MLYIDKKLVCVCVCVCVCVVRWWNYGRALRWVPVIPPAATKQEATFLVSDIALSLDSFAIWDMIPCVKLPSTAWSPPSNLRSSDFLACNSSSLCIWSPRSSWLDLMAKCWRSIMTNGPRLGLEKATIGGPTDLVYYCV